MNRDTGLALLRAEFQKITGLAVEEMNVCSAESGGVVSLLAGGIRFAVEFRAATTEQIRTALQRFSIPKLLAPPHCQAVPLLVVPYMTNAGRALCRDAGVAWLDLSGNAAITAAGLYMRIQGEPNKYKRSGQPETLFAPRSARAARVLLTDRERVWSQTELAGATGLSAGYLSRLLPRYEEAGFVRCEHEGRRLRYSLDNPGALLDAWHADYNFHHHTILRGHVAARGGPELLRELSASLARIEIEYAATGLAGAWMWEPFAAFRLVTLYLPVHPSDEILSRIGFHEGARGSNTWLVMPNDAGVFVGAAEREGVRCVSPLQVYLDLKGQPERAEEAGRELRRVHLAWSNTEADTGPEGEA